jgi:hypothetical protein
MGMKSIEGVENMATMTGYEPQLKFYATRYKQGGRNVFSLDLSLAQVAALLPAPDPRTVYPGNRRITPAHAANFAEYMRSNADWVAPSLILRGPNMFGFEQFADVEQVPGSEFGIIEFPRLATGDIRILDGQHRILGIHMAIQGVADDLDKMRSTLAAARRSQQEPSVIKEIKADISELMAQRRKFERDRVSIQLYVEEDLAAASQMFTDIADNAKPTTTSERVRMDMRKVVNRAMRIVTGHPLLVNRVDLDADRLGRTNKNLLSAKHVADVVRILTVGQDGRVGRRLENELSEVDLAQRGTDFLDVLCDAFPKLADVRDGVLEPDVLRNTSMLGSPVTLRVLAAVYHELRHRDWSRPEIADYFTKLNVAMAGAASQEWVEAVGSDVYFVGGFAPTSRRQDLKLVRDRLVGWALDRPEWLAAA